MEKKNTILLTVIAVATLLVAVVGATFAYFTATTTSTGDQNEQEMTTATVNNIELTTGTVDSFNKIDYPGGVMVVGLQVTASGGDAELAFQLNGEINNGTNTELTYSVYESSNEVDTANLVTGCTLNTSYEGTAGHYSYGDSCVVGSLGTAVLEDQTAANGQTTVTVPSEKLTATTSGQSTYYYLVVKYPESGDDTQNTDQGKIISASLTGASNVVITQAGSTN